MAEKKTFRQQYDIVQGKTPEELIRLVNLKTKFGWKCLGGMVHTPTNREQPPSPPSSARLEVYAYCQSVFKMVPNKKIK
jgi:hypothetical protein